VRGSLKKSNVGKHTKWIKGDSYYPQLLDARGVDLRGAADAGRAGAGDSLLGDGLGNKKTARFDPGRLDDEYLENDLRP